MSGFWEGHRQTSPELCGIPASGSGFGQADRRPVVGGIEL